MKAIEKVAVIGAGTMGAGIAGHVANAGLPVVLLDIVSTDPADRSGPAKSAIVRLLTSRPPALTDPDNAARITPGNLEDDLGLLSDCDLVIEAVVEDLGIKTALFRKLEPILKADAILASNTSTLALSSLTAGLSPGLASRLLVTHFFNPPRQMRLLELVSGPATDPAQAARALDFADRRLGKAVVSCNDAPGFIANRLGSFWMAQAVAEAIQLEMAVDEADRTLSLPFGIPPTGVFGLLDLIGIDVVAKGCASMASALPPSDPAQSAMASARGAFEAMTARGLLGRKTKAGFYRDRIDENGTKHRQILDLASMEYRDAPPPPAAGAKPSLGILDETAPAAAYARAVMVPTLAYAASIVPEAASNPADVDTAMRLGYAWKQGPFQLMDTIGPGRVAEMLADLDRTVPTFLKQAKDGFYRQNAVVDAEGQFRPLPRPTGAIFAADLRERGTAVLANASASLWDMGDGIALFEIHTKGNTLDDDVMRLLDQSIDRVEQSFRGMVIGGDSANFSVGANLAKTLDWLAEGRADHLGEVIASGQKTLLKLKYAPFPTVAAVAGLALGGGCEIALHCSAIQAHVEAGMGLVECKVGIIPGWGGCAQMLLRAVESLGDLARGAEAAFTVIRGAETSGSAHLAARSFFLRATDGVTMNRDRVLADAKARAMGLAKDYVPSKRAGLELASEASRQALKAAFEKAAGAEGTTPYDTVILEKLAIVLSGGESAPSLVDETLIHAFERQALLALADRPETRARMAHMLKTGKPLRN